MGLRVKRYGPVGEKTVRRMHCPMAFNNRGASWLQEDEVVANPYFGSAMLRCGEQVEIVSGGKAPRKE